MEATFVDEVVYVATFALEEGEKHTLGGVGREGAHDFDVLVHHANIQLLEDVGGRGDALRAVLDQAVGAVAYAGGDGAWHSKDVAALLQGDKSGWSTAQFMRGVALAHLNNLEMARSSFKESIQMCLEIDNVAGCASGADGLAFVAISAHDTARAARFAGLAEALREKQGYRVELIERPMHEHTISALNALMDGSQLEQAISEGRKLYIEQAMAYELQI